MTTLTLVLAACAAFLAFWAGTVSLIGLMGWKPLARRYPADQWPEEEGHHLAWQSASVGPSNYNGVLHAARTAAGFYLKPVRLFAYNHPPLFIPWDAVVETKRRWFGGIRLQLEGGGSLALRGRVAKEVRAALAAWDAGLIASESSERLVLDDPELLPGSEVPERDRQRQRT